MSKHNEDWKETFIDRNIGELALDYSRIHGANINIARITPEVIDGLKPVQRRVLYIMHLKDQGKVKRKLASISGDTFGRIHPHCIHGDTKLMMNDECTSISIRELYDKHIDSINGISYADPGVINYDSIIRDIRITKYVDELYKLTFSNGADFKCTNDHEILIIRNDVNTWVRADDIICGDELYPGNLKVNLFNDIRHIYVSSIEVIKYDEPIPVYDFTVDEYENALIDIRNGDNCLIFVHNSPTSISDAVVGMEQPWHNNIPLVTGYGNWGTCHSADTEILTAVGWKLFENIKDDDLIASVDPDSKRIIYECPTKIIKYHHKGSMLCINNESINFMVTPDHKMFIAPYTDGKFGSLEFIEARNLPRRIKFVSKIGNVLKKNVTGNARNIYQWAGGKSLVINTKREIKRIPYDGMVYCVEVPTYHTIITKRNGKVLLSGNCSGDPAGAERYIQATLSEYSLACFFDDWKDAVVDMVMGSDEETKEPLYLPAKYPNVLINGCLGIGYGLSSNIPPFNFKEVVEACITLMHNPNADIILIPDSPTGASIIEGDFARFSNGSSGSYQMRCTYDIDAENNIIMITSVPYLVSLNAIRAKIADIKDKGGLSELVDMNDLTDTSIKLQLVIRNDVNPYKFMKKLIKEVAGLEKSYPVNLTVTNDYETFDYSTKDILLRWIQYRREQKRLVMNNKRTSLMADQRINDVKIFLMSEKNLNEVQHIFRTGRNRAEIERKLIDTYKHSEIHMDSIMARTLSNLRMIDLSIEAYEDCLKLREELIKDLEEVEEILKDNDGIDKLIIAELRDGVKRFGNPRKSNVVPYKISAGTEVAGMCILQLSSDGMITRKMATNVDEEPVPADSNGFAVVVDNDSSFILVDHTAHHAFIKVKDLPVDAEVPVNRYSKQNLSGDIVAMLPVDIENTEMCCVIISKLGQLKKIRISDIGSSKKPIISLTQGDRIVRGIVTRMKTVKDILVFTKNGMGQRFDPNLVRVTSPTAKGGNGFKLTGDDEIVGCYAINPDENQYILYMTAKGKARLNLLDYLTQRDSKHDAMLNLISLNDRDKLVSVVGCNKLDKVQVFFDDGSDEIISIEHIPESTMSSDPKKVTSKNAVTTNVVKVKVL